MTATCVHESRWFRCRLCWPLPDGGWTSADEIMQARLQAERALEHSLATLRSIRPIPGAVFEP